LTTTTFFGLKEEPFKDNLDERFYYSTKQHERAYASMVFCITSNEPAGIILGQSGLGKSLISQRILKAIKEYPQYIPALVLIYPQMPKTALLKEILSQIGVEVPKKNPTTQDLLDLLHSYIIARYREGKRLVLILDESHFLNVQALHLLRSLTNLETPKEKLITAIFIAEDRFVRRLQYKTYESLRTRIKIKARLEPLNLDETEEYVKHRLSVAGCENSLFADEVFPVIYEKSHGICRNISKIAGQALFDAAFEEKKTIGLAQLQDSLKGLEGLL
jgi:general secretion pathway protein A